MAAIRRNRITTAMRSAAIVLWLCAVADARAQDRRGTFSIPAQPLNSSLLQLGRQADVSIAFSRTLVEGHTSEAIEGEMDLRSALSRLLASSGLSYEFVRPTLVRIIAAPAPVAVLAVVEPEGEVAEVIVTARLRSEMLLRVPISIYVVSGEEAAAHNLNNVASLSAYVPTLQFRPSMAQKDRALFIRGIGTIATSQNVEPSVATVIDGVVMSRGGQAMLDIIDLDRVEVLSGPQGTLFGRNASAGVLNVTTNDPTRYLSGGIRAALYDDNEYRVSGAIGGPLSQSVGARLSLFTGSFVGNMTNLNDGHHVNGFRHDGARAKFVYEPRDDLVLRLGLDVTRSFEDVPSGAFTSSDLVVYCPSYLIDPPNPNPCTRDVVQPNAPLAELMETLGLHPSRDNREINIDSDNRTEDLNRGASLQADWKVGGDYELTSISAWRSWRNTARGYDFDQLGAYNLTRPQISDNYQVSFSQASQEIRVASPKDRRLDFVAGLYYMHSDSEEAYFREVVRQTSASATPQIDFGRNHQSSTSDNLAAFGELNFQLGQRWRTFLGYRHIWDRITFSLDRESTATALNRVPAVAPSFSADGEHSVNSWAGRTGLEFEMTDNVMTYVTASRGYKGPAYNVFFNMQSFNTPPLNPERSDAYEIGIKSRLWDRRLQLELAAFSTEFHDYQATREQYVNNTPVTNLLNAGTVANRGAELRATFAPASGLTGRLGALYNDAFVRRFNCEPGLMFCNLNGNALPFASRWHINASQDYRRGLGNDLDLTLNVAYRWQSETPYQYIDTPDTAQPAYGIWDLSVGLSDPNDRWSAALLIKNALDQDYSSYLTQGNVGGVVRWVPRDASRYAGLTFQLSF